MNELYNEYEKAKELYEHGIKSINTRHLILLGKYLHQEIGLGEKRIKKEIILKCKDVDECFNPIVKRSMIDFVVRKSMIDKPLTNVSTVYFYESELNRIREIHNFKYQCLFLSMLAISKLKKSNPASSKHFINYKDIPLAISLSRSHYNKKTFEDNLISEFYKLGMTLYNQRYDIFELLYANPEGEKIFSFSVGENVKEKYVEYLGGEIGYCLDCGKEFIKNSQRHKYDKDCYESRHKISKKVWWNKNAGKLDQ